LGGAGGVAPPVCATGVSLLAVWCLIGATPLGQLDAHRDTPAAQFIRNCRWLQLIHKDQLVPLENAPFSTQ